MCQSFERPRHARWSSPGRDTSRSHTDRSRLPEERWRRPRPLQKAAKRSVPSLALRCFARDLLAVLRSHDASQPPPPPPSPPKASRWRRFLQGVGSVTIVSVLSTGGLFYYVTQKERNPGPQLPFDPSKKTVVVLGSGWASASFLKNLDTANYNVVRLYLSE